jgi:hypothetical protein
MLAVAALAMGAAVTFIASYDPPTARAESGRRICVYTDTLKGNVHTWTVIDYSRGSGCPRVSQPEANTRRGDPAKVTCEEFTSWLGKPASAGMNLGNDACPTFTNDDVYLVQKDEKTTTYRWASKGNYKKFQRSISFHLKWGSFSVYEFCAETYDIDMVKLRGDCDKVGVNGTSRLYYDAGTAYVRFMEHAQTSTGYWHSPMDVRDGTGGDALNYCVVHDPNEPDEYATSDNYC